MNLGSAQWAALMLLVVAGCPTRTVYYDAGADHGEINQAGAAGHDASGTAGGAAASAVAGTGGGTAGHVGGPGGSAGNLGGSTGGSAGTVGAAGAGGIGGAACGRSCLGGSCQAGKCQPFRIAQYTGDPVVLQVGEASVYVTTDIGYIGKAAKDGSDLAAPRMPSLVTSAFVGTQIAEDGDRVFFVWQSSGFRVAFCSSGSCEATITPIGGDYSQYFAVDQADHRIAWIGYSPTQILVGPTTGTVMGTPISSGTDPTSSGMPLYYAQGGLFIAAETNVQRVPLTGGTFRTAAYGSGNVAVVGDNGSNLYFYDGTSIRFTPLPAGNGALGEKLIDTPFSPGTARKFAADLQTAYWIAAGKIHTCQLTQCTATEQIIPTLASVDVDDLGIDQDALYWVTGPEGSLPSGPEYFSVWKLAR